MTGTEIALSLVGPLSALAWWVANRANEKRVRQLVVEEFGNVIEVKLASFKDQLNSAKGFRRSESCELMMSRIHERMAATEADHKTLTDYSHAAKHRLSNDVMANTNRIESVHQEVLRLADQLHHLHPNGGSV